MSLSAAHEGGILVCQRRRRERDRHVIELIQCGVQTTFRLGEKACRVKNSLYRAGIWRRLEALPDNRRVPSQSSGVEGLDLCPGPPGLGRFVEFERGA